MTSGAASANAKGMFHRVVQLVVPMYTEANPYRGRVVLWTCGCLVLVFVEGWVNVAFSNAQRDFTNAMSERDEGRFWQAINRFGYLLFMAAFVFALGSMAQQRICLEWRSSLTQDCLKSYFTDISFYSASILKQDIDNPGQRIVDDARLCSEEGVMLVSTVIEKFINIFSFVYILYTISPGLVCFVVLYSALATYTSSYLFSAKIKTLQHSMAKMEASLRHFLIHIYHYREEVAFCGGGERELCAVSSAYDELGNTVLAQQHVHTLIEGFRRCFSYLTVLLPYAVTAERYFSGAMTFGEVTQVGTSFYHIRSGLGIAVSKLESLHSINTHFERLGSLLDALEESRTEYSLQAAIPSKTITVTQGDTLEVSNLTIKVPGSPGGTVCKNLSFTLTRGMRILIQGPNGCGKTSLFRAICGLFKNGSGTVQVPDKMFVVPQRTYLPIGSGLREQLWYPHLCDPSCDATLVDVLHKVGLGGLTTRTGGWDTQMDLSSVLSPGEQQRLGFARMLRCRPRVALLDEATSAVDEKSEALLYNTLIKTVPTFISIGHRKSLLQYHSHVLSCTDGSEWRLLTTEALQRLEKET